MAARLQALQNIQRTYNYTPLPELPLSPKTHPAAKSAHFPAARLAMQAAHIYLSGQTHSRMPTTSSQYATQRTCVSLRRSRRFSCVRKGVGVMPQMLILMFCSTDWGRCLCRVPTSLLLLVSVQAIFRIRLISYTLQDGHLRAS